MDWSEAYGWIVAGLVTAAGVILAHWFSENRRRRDFDLSQVYRPLHQDLKRVFEKEQKLTTNPREIWSNDRVRGIEERGLFIPSRHWRIRDALIALNSCLEKTIEAEAELSQLVEEAVNAEIRRRKEDATAREEERLEREQPLPSMDDVQAHIDRALLNFGMEGLVVVDIKQAVVEGDIKALDRLPATKERYFYAYQRLGELRTPRVHETLSSLREEVYRVVEPQAKSYRKTFLDQRASFFAKAHELLQHLETRIKSSE